MQWLPFNDSASRIKVDLDSADNSTNSRIECDLHWGFWRFTHHHVRADGHATLKLFCCEGEFGGAVTLLFRLFG